MFKMYQVSKANKNATGNSIAKRKMFDLIILFSGSEEIVE